MARSDLPPAPPIRRSARVLLVDAADRVLLFQVRAADPEAGGFWFTPGGGIEDGEDQRSAAARELAEETGCVTDPAALVGPVWVRRHVGAAFDSRETFFLLRVDRHDVDTSGFTEWERQALQGYRWWSLPQLAAANDTFAPRRIGAFLRRLLAGPWSGPPVEVGV